MDPQQDKDQLEFSFTPPVAQTATRLASTLSAPSPSTSSLIQQASQSAASASALALASASSTHDTTATLADDLAPQRRRLTPAEKLARMRAYKTEVMQRGPPPDTNMFEMRTAPGEWANEMQFFMSRLKNMAGSSGSQADALASLQAKWDEVQSRPKFAPRPPRKTPPSDSSSLDSGDQPQRKDSDEIGDRSAALGQVGQGGMGGDGASDQQSHGSQMSPGC